MEGINNFLVVYGRNLHLYQGSRIKTECETGISCHQKVSAVFFLPMCTGVHDRLTVSGIHILLS